MSPKESRILSKEYEASLAILDAITPSGFIWSAREMSEIIGCTQEWVNRSSRSAKKKILRSETLKQHHRELA